MDAVKGVFGAVASLVSSSPGGKKAVRADKMTKLFRGGGGGKGGTRRLQSRYQGPQQQGANTMMSDKLG
jgi:hypothetical protein